MNKLNDLVSWFQDKDKVQIKESGELGQINGLGTNFISVILESGQEKRFW